MAGPAWFLRRLWQRLPRRHLTDDRLLALALDTTNESMRSSAATACHLRVCRRCESRFSALTTLLATMPHVANAGFEDVFTPQRLQAQRARIGHRLARLVGTVEPARVLAFPFFGRPFERLDFGRGRWLAAAAAAGLLLGVITGQLLHFRPAATQTTTTGSAAVVDATAPSAAALDSSAVTLDMLDMTGTVALPAPHDDGQTQGSPLTLAEFAQLIEEEGFLGNLDLALASYQVSELESIDALTPRVRDFSSQLR